MHDWEQAPAQPPLEVHHFATRPLPPAPEHPQAQLTRSVLPNSQPDGREEQPQVAETHRQQGAKHPGDC